MMGECIIFTFFTEGSNFFLYGSFDDDDEDEDEEEDCGRTVCFLPHMENLAKVWEKV